MTRLHAGARRGPSADFSRRAAIRLRCRASTTTSRCARPRACPPLAEAAVVNTQRRTSRAIAGRHGSSPASFDVMSTPALPDFQREIGTRMSRGDFAGAAAAAAGCRAAWPSDSAGWLLGSIAALHADQKETALALVEERLAIDPKDVQCALQKAECLLALGRRAESLQAPDSA